MFIGVFMEKCKVGIKGFDEITYGGFNLGSINIITGGAGVGKTSFGFSYAYNGAKFGEPSAFITLEESRESIISTMGKTYPDIYSLENTGLLSIIDLTSLRSLSTISEERSIDNSIIESESFIDFISTQIKKLKLKRLVIDGLAPFRIRYVSDEELRNAFFVIINALQELGVTAVITTEQDTCERLTRFGIEEFMGDSISTISMNDYFRFIEVHKMRGSNFMPGLHSFEITDRGIEIYPTLGPVGFLTPSLERIQTGVEGLDDMLSGGLFRGNCVLVVGSAGTGKTTLGMQFIAKGVKLGEPSLYVSFSETQGELLRNYPILAQDLKKGLDTKLLHILNHSGIKLNPSRAIHLLKEKFSNEYAGLKRLVVDPLDDYLTAVASQHGEENAVKAIRTLISILKFHNVTSLLMCETYDFESRRIPRKELFHYVDGVIMLNHVEIGSELRRSISVLKMKGSRHATEIREFIIGKKGAYVGKKFENLEGLMSGIPNISSIQKR